MIREANGICHLYYSRWRKEHGFQAWVTHSEVAHAVADRPCGPYRPVETTLPERGPDFWDGHCTHNPVVLRSGGRYYLYYMGNRGDRVPTGISGGLNWTHRNAQRIGLAVADSPWGPWVRHDQPLINITPGFHDALCCANPTVTLRQDGSVLMIYKAVGAEGELPFGGPVVHVVATAASPEGPFTKHPDAVFTKPGAIFPAEDSCLWVDAAGYHAIVKDMKGYFTGEGTSLARLYSPDGFSWKPADPVLVSRTEYVRADGGIESLNALERPQIWCDEAGPAVLFCAAAPNSLGQRNDSWNVAIPIVR